MSAYFLLFIFGLRRRRHDIHWHVNTTTATAKHRLESCLAAADHHQIKSFQNDFDILSHLRPIDE
jgi:hypothetical protein